MLQIDQGDILKTEGIKDPLLVVSKNIFNRYENIIACPILSGVKESALHIKIQTEKIQGVVLCEQMKFLDLRKRGYTKMDQVAYEEIINITDAIQSIFDYL